MIDAFHDHDTGFEGFFRYMLTNRFDDEFDLTEDTVHRGTGILEQEVHWQAKSYMDYTDHNDNDVMDRLSLLALLVLACY